MGKRTLLAEDGADSAPTSKRKKLDNYLPLETNEHISIKTAADIRRLLTFDQNDLVRFRLSLQTFRQYLDQAELGKATGFEDRTLLEYLTTATASSDQAEALPELFQAWRYAVQTHDEGLMTAIPGVLALLLRTISSVLDFAEIGVQICKNIVRKENEVIFQKSLNSPRARDATIARSLDLLTEIVSFDGGTCARNVWLQRGTTMQRLPQFLTMSKKTIYGPKEPISIRDYAVIFFLANLRFQNQEAKAEILSTRKITQTMLRDILLEKQGVIKEILSTLENYVLRDDKLSKSAKGHVLTDTNLGFILGIMRHNPEDGKWRALRELSESFLMTSCTSQAHGIVYKQHGWYPPGTEDLSLKQDASFLSNQTTVTDSGKYKDSVPVRNTTLAAFVQDLKPWASLSERKLLLSIFEAAPELIGDYFLRKKIFSFEPKLTVTWIGWTAFIYSALRIPIPNHEPYVDGRVKAPPPVSVIVQSILPQSLTQQTLAKALKHKSELIQLFSLRVLNASFQRLKKVLAMFQSSDSPNAWKATATQILREVESRLPQYKQILNLYQSCSKEKHVLREILSSLLALYNTVTPHLVSADKWDISAQITKMLNQVTEEVDHIDASTLMELEHLLEIGNCALEAKWWQKPANTSITSITTILQLLTSTRLGGNTSLKSLVRSILEEGYVLVTMKSVDSVEALLSSLRDINIYHKGFLFVHLDDCLLRLNRKPIKYHGDAMDLVNGNTKYARSSPVFMVLLEQWPFFMKAHDKKLNIACAEWQCRYMVEAAKAGESCTSLRALCKRFLECTTNKKLNRLFKDCKSKLKEEQTRRKTNVLMESAVPEEITRDLFAEQVEETQSILETRLALTKETENHPALTGWSKKHVSDAILDSDISDLIRYLASSYPEVRIQAVSALRNFMSKLQISKYEERQSTYLLIGSLLLTIRQHDAQSPLPSIALAFAAGGILVLTNPLHPIYAKLNSYLSRSPSWDLTKLASYWQYKIFHEPPTEPEGHWKEVEWLLDVLLDGLRTESDVNLYRRKSVFGRLANNITVSVPRKCYEKMIDILYRCAILGCATTLITRFGIMPWLGTQIHMDTKYKVLLCALKQKIQSTSDKDRVQKWAGNMMDSVDKGPSTSVKEAVGTNHSKVET